MLFVCITLLPIISAYLLRKEPDATGPGFFFFAGMNLRFLIFFIFATTIRNKISCKIWISNLSSTQLNIRQNECGYD